MQALTCPSHCTAAGKSQSRCQDECAGCKLVTGKQAMKEQWEEAEDIF